MESRFIDNFLVFDRGHKLKNIVLEGRYINKAANRVRNIVWVGKEYDNADSLINDIEEASVSFNRDGYNCYWVMNTISLDIVKGYEGKKRIDGLSVGDDDIEERNGILIDVDRRENTKVPASQGEMDQAYSIAKAIIAFLIKEGFPKPALVMSGNGYHIIIRLDHWPNTEETKNLVQDFLNHIGELFNTDTHRVDTSVHNASRITKMIDTVAMKGPNTKVRPWRRSKMLQEPNGKLLSIEKMSEFLPDKPAPRVKPKEPPSLFVVQKEGFDAVARQPLFSKEVELQRFEDALKHFDPDDDRGEGQFKDGENYLAVVFAGSSLGEEAREITRAWCKQSKEKYIENDFNNDWKSGGNHPNPVTVASMYYYIKKKNEDAFEIGLSDVANGHRFASKFQGSLLSVLDSDIWIIWSDGVGWKKATSDVPIRAAKAVLQDMRDETAKAIKEGKDVKRMLAEVSRTSKANNLESMVKMAKTEDGMSVTFDLLVLNCTEN